MTRDHLTMELLLAVRDGDRSEPGYAAAHRHIAECATCRDELDRLHQRTALLRALPSMTPAGDRFPVVRQRLAEAQQHRWQRRAALVGLAAAATLAIAVVGHDLARPDALAASEQLQTAMSRSELLERTLNAWQPATRAIDTRAAQVIIELEDRIADVDGRLARTSELAQDQRLAQQVKLWQERVGLMSALVDVHLTKATNVDL